MPSELDYFQVETTVMRYEIFNRKEFMPLIQEVRGKESFKNTTMNLLLGFI